jgi:polyhydroxyalkanoate synthesis repressor PhaR
MTEQPPPHVVHIKKYPNRRFYDQTRSRHVKLDELYQLVQDGHEIVVTDSAGNDITNVVLTQLILEHDPPKLDLFPATLLHQAIQANQEMVKTFVDQYFSRAMDAFLASRQQFDAFLAQAGLSPLQPLTPFDWAQRFLFGMTRETSPGASPAPEPPAESPTPAPEDFHALRDEIESLRSEVQRLRDSTAQKPKKKS